MNKAKAMLKAVEIAEKGFRSSRLAFAATCVAGGGIGVWVGVWPRGVGDPVA